jgi:hypothetical protein
MSVPKGGGMPVVVASSQIQPSGIVVDATYVYWSNYAWGNVTMGTVMRAAKNGGAPEVLASGLAHPGAMAQDATALYWTAASAVMRLAK